MEKKNEKFETAEWLKDLPAKTENFSPEQMLDCPQCGRKNAPTRLKCLYCSAELPASDFAVGKQLSRKLESWEKGFNVIFLPNDKNLSQEKASEIAKMLRLEKDDLQNILDAGKILPVACAESETEAGTLAQSLREKNLETTIISDETLQLEKFPRRLRAFDFLDDKIVLRLFNSDEKVEIAREDLVLIVVGALFKRRIESVQKHQRKKENKLIDTIELSSDELLIDIYSKKDAIGYRVEANGFDFSCLGNEKQLLAAQNMRKLAEKLREFGTNAKFDADYSRLRAELSYVWENEEKKNSKGFVKRGFGKSHLESVTTIDNLKQFTRYSRMLKNLL